MSKQTDTPTAAQVAKVRRSGATWNGTREHFGLKWPSGKLLDPAEWDEEYGGLCSFADLLAAVEEAR